MSSEEVDALRSALSRSSTRVQELESAIGAEPGEDAQIAAHRFTQKEYERGQLSCADVVSQLQERVESLLRANTEEVMRRRRVTATVQLIRDTTVLLAAPEIGNE